MSAAKRPKLEASSTPQQKQSSLTSFFGSSKPKVVPVGATNEGNETSQAPPINPNLLDPIIPAPTPITTSWRTHLDCLLLRHAQKDRPRDKVAAFDLDGTLLVWRSSSLWPSQLEHYELWNASVFATLQQRYEEGYKLVLITNQGAIRKAFTGKNATRVKTIIEWIVSQLHRPLHAIISTNSKAGFHKPSKDLWNVIEQQINGGVEFNIKESFYVGDSIEDNPEDPQGGVDSKFAKNVGQMKGTTLRFYTPDEYFGPSTASRRTCSGEMAKFESPPKNSLLITAALSGGYLRGPILLILCGVQGSGKSTFCHKLLNGSPETWLHLSQDTINNGKPGKREQVETQAMLNLQQGKSVVVDRMHLDEEQRSFFINVAKQAGTPVHALLLQPPKEVVLQRVKTRTNHPAGVEGEKGARIAAISLGRVVVPSYKEGLDFVCVARSDEGVARLAALYQMVSDNNNSIRSLPKSFLLAPHVEMPSITLGTMKIGKRIAKDTISMAIRSGLNAIDTSPTYNNEAEIGTNLKEDTFVIIKVPKRAVQPADVRKELSASLSNLCRCKADLLLLHWPSDVMAAGTLTEVWQEMENLVKEGQVSSIGVCNFNIDALRQLLSICSIRPSINQVERHPMLPQWDLFDFCCTHDILLQAHTPLGQGNSQLLEHETIQEVARSNNLTPAQVILQWNLLHRVAVIPKFASKNHLDEVASLLESGSSLLNTSSMKALDCITERKRFVAPPFMYSPKAIYAWGDRIA